MPFPAWRQERLRRRKNGRFGVWVGGQGNGEYTAHGVKTHIGDEFRHQNGRVGRPGDTVRKKTLEGHFHRGAEWWIHTATGWMNAGTKTTKPTEAEVREILRTGRKARR